MSGTEILPPIRPNRGTHILLDICETLQYQWAISDDKKLIAFSNLLRNLPVPATKKYVVLQAKVNELVKWIEDEIRHV